jgi:hypothetical protein
MDKEGTVYRKNVRAFLAGKYVEDIQHGVVVAINELYITKVVFDDGEFALVEPLGYDLEIGDEIVGDMWQLGGCDLYNQTNEEWFSAFIQDHS